MEHWIYLERKNLFKSIENIKNKINCCDKIWHDFWNTYLTAYEMKLEATLKQINILENSYDDDAIATENYYEKEEKSDE